MQLNAVVFGIYLFHFLGKSWKSGAKFLNYNLEFW